MKYFKQKGERQMLKKYSIFTISIIFLLTACAHRRMAKSEADKEILSGINDIKTELTSLKKELSKPVTKSEPEEKKPADMIFENLKSKPRTTDIKLKHSPPISQGGTGTCWCFSTTAFLESELVRLDKGYYDLSEMFTVYYAYLEKFERFIETKGEQNFGQGGLSHDVIHVMKKYGAVREIDYDGRFQKGLVHNHRAMFREFRTIMRNAKESSTWNKEEILADAREVLDRRIGKPPEKIKVGGKEITPYEFAHDVLEIPFDDYIEITSYSYMPFNKQGKLTVGDNWMQNENYYNVTLDDFMEQFKNSILNGYTIVIDYDVSELGNLATHGYYVIPEETAKQEDVNQATRDEMFKTKKTRDEHLIQIIGYKKEDDHDWYLVRDSSVAFRSPFHGYMFMRDDYVKLKILAYMIHKDALMEKISEKF